MTLQFNVGKAVAVGFFGVVFLTPLTLIHAQVGGSGSTGFVELVGLPGLTSTPQNNFPAYIDALYTLAISVAAILAVLKIILAGAKYMTTDLVSSKGDAKSDITSALLGLLIIIAAVLILNEINPSLTNINNITGKRAESTLAPIFPIENACGCTASELQSGSCSLDKVKNSDKCGEVCTKSDSGMLVIDSSNFLAICKPEGSDGSVLDIVFSKTITEDETYEDFSGFDKTKIIGQFNYKWAEVSVSVAEYREAALNACKKIGGTKVPAEITVTEGGELTEFARFYCLK